MSYMIEIEKTIVSIDVIERKFVCDLDKCKGECCVHGASGAPLEPQEMDTLEQIYEQVKPYMTKAGIEAVEKQGKHVIDSDGDNVTPLVDNKECVYVYWDEKKVAKCAIEKAYNEGKITFRKPVSCHLYPIRVEKYANFEAVNYNVQKMCAPARVLGDKIGVPVYKFVKEALIRKYGTAWYEQLEVIATEWHQQKH